MKFFFVFYFKLFYNQYLVIKIMTSNNLEVLSIRSIDQMVKVFIVILTYIFFKLIRYYLKIVFEKESIIILGHNNESLREAIKEWIDDQQKTMRKYGHISNWDTSDVTDMSELFKDCKEFNDDISSWDVSQVTTMNGMFCGAVAFNQDIGQWNVSKVTTMRCMFSDAVDFNQDIGQWDVSKVTTMRCMFFRAAAFNQDIGQWNVSQVTDMYTMFWTAYVFNQPVGQWNVSQVEDMTYMFSGCRDFNQDISKWNVFQVTSMLGMFYHATAFNQDIGKWPIRFRCGTSKMFKESGVSENTFSGIYGDSIAYYFDLENPDEDTVMEPYTRWERRKNAVMFFSSISKMNMIENDSEEIKSNLTLNTLHSMDDNIYKKIVLFI